MSHITFIELISHTSCHKYTKVSTGASRCPGTRCHMHVNMHVCPVQSIMMHVAMWWHITHQTCREISFVPKGKYRLHSLYNLSTICKCVLLKVMIAWVITICNYIFGTALWWSFEHYIVYVQYLPTNVGSPLHNPSLSGLPINSRLKYYTLKGFGKLGPFKLGDILTFLVRHTIVQMGMHFFR